VYRIPLTHRPGRHSDRASGEIRPSTRPQNLSRGRRHACLFSLWRKARRENSAASRLLGTTSLRFALHGWQRDVGAADVALVQRLVDGRQIGGIVLLEELRYRLVDSLVFGGTVKGGIVSHLPWASLQGNAALVSGRRGRYAAVVDGNDRPDLGTIIQ
ncbi:hypothetical protein, partial [Thiolapillus sp.]|uniref:hypothetical protein n=2 Tax=Thiolapillus sp. TaxID=2017437 RepID=UPI003AF6A297